MLDDDRMCFAMNHLYVKSYIRCVIGRRTHQNQSTVTQGRPCIGEISIQRYTDNKTSAQTRNTQRVYCF